MKAPNNQINDVNVKQGLLTVVAKKRRMLPNGVIFRKSKMFK